MFNIAIYERIERKREEREQQSNNPTIYPEDIFVGLFLVEISSFSL